MRLDEYTALDATGLAAHLRAGDVTAGEVEAVARDAIARADALVNGLAYPLFDEPLQHAADGPWAGVPFLLKDVPMARGVPFSLGSRAVPDVPAPADHPLMTRFRAAGLAAYGSTAMCELGLSFATEPGRTGPVRNPYDPGRGAGGSSGGAAALVAAGAVPVAHANDGAGSIRVPASCCGLVGLKPSRGRVPSPGPGLGLLHEFAVTRTVRDAARLLQLVQGPVPGDPWALDVTPRPPAGPLRVAVLTEAWNGAPVAAQVVAAVERAGRLLAHLGHTVVPAGPALDWDEVLEGVLGETVANAAPLMSAPRPPDPARLEGVTRRLLAEVSRLSALDLLRSMAARDAVTRRTGAFMTGFDVLVTPTLAQLPAPHGTLDYDSDRYTVRGWLEKLFTYGPFTAVCNLTGQPALSLPLAVSAEGLPVGVQLIAGHGRDELLLALAGELEPEFDPPVRARS